MTPSAAESPAAVVVPPAVVGLRERKKARTRATIRTEAIRLFDEQGFASTTVEQIAEAADISPSTFFRYFPTKEAVIITDDYDPLIFQEFRNQPADVPPVRAFRNALTSVFAQITEAGREQEQVRQKLLQTIPELRSAMLEEFGVSIRMLSELISERVDRAPDDPQVRALAGAIIGVVLSVAVAYWNPSVPGQGGAETGEMGEMTTAVIAALELLEQGLPV